MKISELVAQLHTIKFEHGDLDVHIALANGVNHDGTYDDALRDVIIDTPIDQVHKTRDHRTLIVVLDNWPALPEGER